MVGGGNGVGCQRAMVRRVPFSLAYTVLLRTPPPPCCTQWSPLHAISMRAGFRGCLLCRGCRGGGGHARAGVSCTCVRPWRESTYVRASKPLSTSHLSRPGPSPPTHTASWPSYVHVRGCRWLGCIGLVCVGGRCDAWASWGCLLTGLRAMPHVSCSSACVR